MRECISQGYGHIGRKNHYVLGEAEDCILRCYFIILQSFLENVHRIFLRHGFSLRDMSQLVNVRPIRLRRNVIRQYCDHCGEDEATKEALFDSQEVLLLRRFCDRCLVATTTGTSI